MLRKILIGVGVLAALLIVAAIAVLSLVDVDHYKPRIEQAAADKLDRKLRFDGRLALSLFPNLAIDLPHTTLSERGSEAPFLSFDRARVSIAVWPLLSGRVEAGTVSLHGLRATIVHRADGTTNVDDLSAGKPTPRAGEAPHPGVGVPPSFEIGGIDLVDAQVVYRDEPAGNTVTVSRLNLTTGRIATRSSVPVQFSASVAATQPPTAVDLSLKATADVDLAARAYAARSLEAQVHGHAGENRFDIALTAPQVAVDVEQEKTSVAALTGEVQLDSPALPQKSLKLRLDGSLNVDARTQDLAAKLAAHFDETTASTRVEVHDFAAPRFAFDVDIDRLNLDRYLPAPAQNAGAGKPSVAPSGAKEVPLAADDPKVDLSALKSLNLAGEARIGSLQVHNAKAARIKVGVHATGGQLELAPVTASLYQGALAARAKVDAQASRIGVDTTLDGISIEPLLHDLTGKDILEGHGGLKMSLTTAGPTVGAMRRALGGTASLALHDGAVHGIDVARTLRNLRTALAGGSAQAQAADSTQKTDFSELTASFSIRNGVATNNDLQAKSPVLHVTGAGSIDIGASALDYTAQASVVGADLPALQGVMVPVHLTGPFSALSYRLDWASVARQAAKGQAVERLKGLLGGKSSQGGQSAAPNPADVLKGLLGR